MNKCLTGLEQHEGELLITEFSFLGEIWSKMEIGSTAVLIHFSINTHCFQSHWKHLHHIIKNLHVKAFICGVKNSWWNQTGCRSACFQVGLPCGHNVWRLFVPISTCLRGGEHTAGIEEFPASRRGYCCAEKGLKVQKIFQAGLNIPHWFLSPSSVGRSHVALVVCPLSENLDNTQPLWTTKDITEKKISS